MFTNNFGIFLKTKDIPTRTRKQRIYQLVRENMKKKEDSSNVNLL